MKLNLWLHSRLFAVLFFYGYFLDFEFIVFVLGFFLIHLINGLKNILSDYIHINRLILLLISLIRIFFIFFLINISKNCI